MRCQIFSTLLVFAAVFALPPAAEAVLLPINQPSFENPVTAPAMFTGTTTTGPTGWTVYNTVAANNLRYFGVWNPATTPSYTNGVPAGANVGVVFLENTSNFAEAGLQQTLASTLQLSTQYTLTVEVGNFGAYAGAGWDFAGFPGYRVDLFAGGTLIASDNNTLAPAEAQFLTSTVSFTTGASHANAGQPLTIRLINLNGPAGIEVNFDQVRLDAIAVPEPSSVALLALGAMLGLRGRCSGFSATADRGARRGRASSARRDAGSRRPAE